MARPKKLPDGMVTRAGRDGYFCDFCAGGRRVRKFRSTSLDAAKTILNQLKARHDLADFDILDNDVPVEDLHEAYRRHLEQTKKPRTLAR